MRVELFCCLIVMFCLHFVVFMCFEIILCLIFSLVLLREIFLFLFGRPLTVGLSKRPPTAFQFSIPNAWNTKGKEVEIVATISSFDLDLFQLYFEVSP